MAERETFQTGAVEFPLTSETTNTSLQDADPVVFHCLEFIQHCIEKYAGERILAEATKFGVTELTKVVASTVPWDPADYLSTAQFHFPLLAMHRIKTKFSEKTTVFRHDESAIELAYIFPPVSAGQAGALLPLLRSVAAIIDNRIELGYDPTFTPEGGAAGDQVWALAGIESISVVGATWEKYAGMGDMIFHAVVLDVAVKEMAKPGPIEAWPLLSGMSAQVDLQPNTGEDGGIDEGPVVASVALATVNFNFEAISLSPSTGSIAGGTSITITGTGFTSPSRVLIGGMPAGNVSVVSATSITCTTPQFTGYPPVADVTVININSQSSTIPSGFTYTA